MTDNYKEACGCHGPREADGRRAQNSSLNIETACCDGCSHSHGERDSGSEKRTRAVGAVFTAASAALLILGIMPVLSDYKTVFFVSSALLSGYELIPSALAGLKRHKMNEDLLVLIAVVAAFCIGEGAEAAAVSLFFKIGESVEDFAVERSERAIKKLYEITDETATVIASDGSTKTVDSKQVQAGDILLVPPFGRVAVDCVALGDGGAVDASAITGEAIPVEVYENMSILSGSVNGGTAIKVRATADYKSSAAARIIETVENSQRAKGNADKFITKFAGIYTPAAVGLAAVIAVVPSLIFGAWSDYIHRALVFLVASCPCALVLSVPLGFFAAIGAQSKLGVIVKGGKYIEKLAKTDAVLFDKTGTLTDDGFEIDGIFTCGGADEKEVLRLAAYAERYSVHPLAAAVRRAYGEIDETKIDGFKELSGSGTEIMLDGVQILCGSRRLMKDNSVNIGDAPQAQIYVAADGALKGAITLSGRLRKTSRKTVEELYGLGIKKIIMLTGDNEKEAENTAEKCGIKEFRAGLLPEQKTEFLEELKNSGYSPAFVGDGINDTPTLASADVGIAMGSGAAAAVEVGDVVLMNTNPESLVRSIKTARRGMAVIWENIWFAVTVKAAVLVLGALGVAPMWAAVFADVGVCILTVLNASRLLIVKK